MSVCLKTAGILPYNKNPLYQRQKDDDNILYGLHYDASSGSLFLLFCGFSLKSVVYIFMISLVTLVLVKVAYRRPFVII